MKKNILSVLNKNILRCPICKTKFNAQEQFIACLNNHTYDIAKDGYINVSLRRPKTIYGQELFNARKTITQQGFFDSLEEMIVKNISDKYLKTEQFVILDAGCGEGSLFSRILRSLKWKGFSYTAIGIDSVKEGIKLASKKDHSVFWLVGDISNIPLVDNTVDIILNTLSPANYSEFNRLLKDDGIVLKSIPNEGHLKELRKIIGKTDYSNDSVSRLFSISLSIVKKHNVRYAKKLNQEQRKLVWVMTPLTQKSGKIENQSGAIERVTVDLAILIGQKKTTFR